MANKQGRKIGTKNAGRPLRFKTPIELQRAVDGYFNQCKQENKKPMLTALYNYLNCWHGYFQELVQAHPNFSNTIKRTIARMAEVYEIGTSNKTTIPALGIFMLKNCGYTDRVEVSATVSGSIGLADMAKEAQAIKRKQAN